MNIEQLKKNVYSELAGCKGRASLFMEIEGKIIEFNSQEVYQSASLIKIPILYEALRQIEAGIISPDEHVIIRDSDKIGDTGVLQAIHGVKSYAIKDLLTLMVIVSDNSATNLIIDLLRMESINKTIRSLLMKNTILQRKMLDFQSIKSGMDNFTTAADIVTCLKKGVTGTALTKASRDTFLSILNQQQFREKLPAYMNEEYIIAGNKTGELPGLEHDCAIVTFGQNRTFIAVLIDNLTDPEIGKSAIRQIGKHINDFIRGNSTR
ncbi:MAG: serine hydrolase [Mesobacillus sp.]|uniref:serine hydrolase n=1 Tax=Mesobacillus sp. TaxID=2675271 RepID=UPI003C376479